MCDIHGHLISGVLCLAFCFHIQALYMYFSHFYFCKFNLRTFTEPTKSKEYTVHQKGLTV